MLWYRVFGKGETPPPEEEVLGHVRGLGVEVEGVLTEGEGGWLRAVLGFGDGSPLVVERFAATEEGIRAELNSWAAFLETCDYSPHHAGLMERTIQARQLFTLRRPTDHADEVRVERVCVGLCRFLAKATDGFYQVDDEGFFEPDGTLLVKEY